MILFDLDFLFFFFFLHSIWLCLRTGDTDKRTVNCLCVEHAAVSSVKPPCPLYFTVVHQYSGPVLLRTHTLLVYQQTHKASSMFRSIWQQDKHMDSARARAHTTFTIDRAEEVDGAIVMSSPCNSWVITTAYPRRQPKSAIFLWLSPLTSGVTSTTCTYLSVCVLLAVSFRPLNLKSVVWLL